MSKYSSTECNVTDQGVCTHIIASLDSEVPGIGLGT